MCILFICQRTPIVFHKLRNSSNINQDQLDRQKAKHIIENKKPKIFVKIKLCEAIKIWFDVFIELR